MTPPLEGTDGREWFRTTLYSIGDAVITTDATGHIREMNAVAEALTGWSEAAAAGRPVNEVFVILNEDTREPVPNPVMRVLAEGIVVGLANHTVLVARDGTERPVADSGAPIRQADGRLAGTVLVFRDQSEERARLRAIEESEVRHRRLFEANPHAMWVYDVDTLAFLAVNDAAVERYGFSREEFLDLTIADIRPAEDVAALRSDLLSLPDAYQSGGPWRHRRKDGSILVVEISSHPIPWFARRARVVLAHDITAHSRLEERLRGQARILARLASREPLAALLDELVRFVAALSDGVRPTVLLADRAAGLLRLGASFGLPSEVNAVADGTPIAEGAGVCGTAAARAAVFAVADTATDPAFGSYRDIADRHRLRGAWSHPFFDSKGQLLGTFAIYVDTPRLPTTAERELSEFAASLAGLVVERSRDADELSASAFRLRAIFDTEPECVKVLDRRGSLIEMNAAGLRLIEADSLEEVRGALVASLVTEPFRDRFRELTLAAADGQEGMLEFEIVGLKGTRRWLETHVVPLRDAQARITSVLGITRDMTERNALAAQLVQAQKMESVGRLAGGVAHDFNNMLSVILGHTELALAELPADSRVRSRLLDVHKAARRSADLTRQLLAFARREPASPRVVDLNVRIPKMLGMLGRLIGEDVIVGWRPGVALWPVRIDPSQLDQILTNLVVNARDAMAGPGTLTIATENLAVDQARASNFEGGVAGDFVAMTVADTGCGMDADTLMQVFEPFFTTKPPGEGTGLGLSTVYGTVKQNGGAVEVESEPGRGTTFRIFLPRSPDVAADVPSPQLRRASGGKGETILVVEDEPAVLDLARLALEGAGYRVLSANSPQAALAQAAAHAGPLDLVVTDVVMPNLNGRELLESLRAIRPDVRCLYMSGYTAEIIARRGILEPGLAFLQKPFVLDQLLTKVREVLDGRLPRLPES